jgi:hypothetical protein
LQDEEMEVKKGRSSLGEQREVGEKEEVGVETRHAEEVANKSV